MNNVKTVKNVYMGNLRTEATHIKSGEVLLTDAPLDNQGRGENFSPSDLLAASLGACMLTIMGIKARNLELDLKGAYAETEKIMAEGPRRVSALLLRIVIPDGAFSSRHRKVLEQAALTCPVALSLHPDIRQEVDFIWE